MKTPGQNRLFQRKHAGTLVVYGALVLCLIAGVLYYRATVLLTPRTARQDAGAAFLDGTIYVFGGQAMVEDGGWLDDALAFDPTERSVRWVGALPWLAPRWSACACAGAEAIYLFSGSDSAERRDEIVRFDPATGETVVVGRLPSGRALGGVASASGKVYYIGGLDADGYLDEVIEFDPAAGSVRTLMSLDSPVYEPAVVADGGMIYVIGGRDDEGSYSDRILEIDVDAAAIRRTGALPSAVSGAAATVLHGTIYVFGGWRRAWLDEIVAIDTSGDELSGDIVGRLDEAVADPVAVTIGDRIVVIGGTPPSSHRELALRELDPTTMAWVDLRFRGSIRP